MKTEENNYIMTSIEIDEQFVDNASDAYMTDEEREYWIDGEEGDTDEEIEETYQMTDEEQKGLEQYLVDTREDVPECRDALVNLLWDTFTGERENADRRMNEILDRNPLIGYDRATEKDLERLNNHFNA
jgi:hypothetical protein